MENRGEKLRGREYSKKINQSVIVATEERKKEKIEEIMTKTQSEMTGVGRGRDTRRVKSPKEVKKKSTSKHIKNYTTFFLMAKEYIASRQEEEKVTFRGVTFKLIFLNRNNGCQKIVK